MDAKKANISLETFEDTVVAYFKEPDYRPSTQEEAKVYNFLDDLKRYTRHEIGDFTCPLCGKGRKHHLIGWDEEKRVYFFDCPRCSAREGNFLYWL